MIAYSMSEVENLTGISSHALRMWERRYNFLQPKRTKNNARYYSDNELKKLLNIGVLIRNGYRISAIDKMTNTKIHELVTDLFNTHAASDQDIINSLVKSMITMDAAAFNAIIQRQTMNRGFLSTITELIYPFLNLVGGLWITQKANPAQEHFITNLVRQKIISAIENLSEPSESAPRILMFLLDGDDHEIGLLLANFIAKYLGWNVYYLGLNVPIENIKPIVEICSPDLLFTMFIAPRPAQLKKLIAEITESIQVSLLVSGNPRNFDEDQAAYNYIYLKSPADLISYLNKNV